MTDPVVLKAKLQQSIDDTFAAKLQGLEADGAPPEKIDKLYRWRD